MIWQNDQWKQLLVTTHQVEKNIQLDNFSIQKRSLGLGRYGLFILGFSGKITEKLDSKLKKICRDETCDFIQIETCNYKENTIKKTESFREGYYKKFITPYTAIIDLGLSIDDILSQMKPKGRYNIKLAEKKGVEAKIVEKSEKNIEDFYNLMGETTSRDNFSGNTFAYYKSFLDIIEESSLILAYKDGVAIAGGIFTFGKEVSIYYYGASSSQKQYRNLMAPYAVQFLAIQEAKNRGSKLYDFLGVATPGDKNSELSGVTDFKLKLTKDTRKVSQSLIWINNRCSYTVLVFMKKLKNILKK